MYRIGIIDDVKSECADIEVSVMDNVGWEADIKFKEYLLEGRKKKDILTEIEKDVQEGEIQALIVDFKLDTSNDVIEGWEIIEFMHDKVPEFPVVIMTNVPDDSRRSEYTDADKVYAKKVFLRPELEETKQLVTNIMLNMEKYVSHRKALETRLSDALGKLDQNSEDEKLLKEIIDIETALGRYKQMYQTVLDATFDMDELKGIFEELKRYEE